MPSEQKGAYGGHLALLRSLPHAGPCEAVRLCVTCRNVHTADGPAARDTMKAKFFYTGIRVKDLEASVKFYTTLLGMKVRGRNTVDAAKGTVVELVCEGDGGNTLELNYYEKGSPFDTNYEVGEGLDHLAFVVKDLDGALAEARKAGNPVVQKMQEPGSRYAYIEDPNGIWIELCQFG